MLRSRYCSFRPNHFILQQFSIRLQSLKRFLERKDISTAIVFTAIAIKFLLYLHFFQLEGDKLFQALGAKNFAEGRGISFQHVTASDLSTRITDPVNRWPVAYSILLAPFYLMTNQIAAACIIVDFLSICFFFFAFYFLLKRLHLQQLLINAIILFCGATFGPSLSKPTDLLACGGLILACLLFIAFLTDRTKRPVFGLALGAAITIPAVFRYMYLPCLFIMPAMLWWVAAARKDKHVLSGVKYTFVAVIVLYATSLGLQNITVGNSTYVIGAGKGFFPSNLLSLYPFIPDAFFNINFTLQQLDSLTHLSYVFLFSCLRYINLLLFAFLVYKWITFVLHRQSDFKTAIDTFILLTGVISGSLLLLLAYLSLTNSSAAIPLRIPFPWTFVGDGRYYLFIMTVLPVVVAYWLFNKQQLMSPKLRQLLKYAFFGLIFFQVAHTLYFLMRRFDPLGLTGDNVLITRQGDLFLRNRIDESLHQGYNVVFTGTDETVSNWAELNGSNGILHVTDLLSTDVHPNKPSIVFVLVGKNMLPSIRDLLVEREFLTERQIGPMTIFSKKYETH